MTSIRVALTFCFLLLLTVALVTSSLFVYRVAQQTLEGKEHATAQLIRKQYEDSLREKEQSFNNTLLLQARSLARLVTLQPDLVQVDRRQMHRLGLLSACLAPNGYLLAPTWLTASVPGPIFYEMYRDTMPVEVRLPENKLPADLRSLVEGQSREYFQINSPRGAPYLSPSLAGRPLPLDMYSFGDDHLIHWEFDELQLLGKDGRRVGVRRVVLKATAPRSPHLAGETDSGDLATPPGGKRQLFAGPTIFVQYALETQKRDADIAGFVARRDQELAALTERTQVELTSLRHRLLGVSMLIFVAAALGSFLLVWLGLAPLRRLGDAVSRISPSDFRLPINADNLPAELKPIVARLTRMLGQLERAFRREKQATADISHELRTPLAALLTTTEFALRKPRSVADYQEVLQDCRQTVQHMHQAIERLLTLARLDAGVDSLRPQKVDLGILAEQCLGIVRPLAEARGLSLILQRKGPLQIHADPDKLREILNNLLHNAIEYNKPGGRIELTLVRDQDRIEVSVHDTGVGIPQSAREHIFERFYRADFARSGDGLHTGLGLPIVKQYVGLMGGNINVESVEGEGSTFRIDLPAGT